MLTMASKNHNIEELRLYLGQLVVLNRDLRTYMDGIDYSARRMFLLRWLIEYRLVALAVRH